MNIDLSFLTNLDLAALGEEFNAFASQNPAAIGAALFLRGGWVVFLAVLAYGMYTVWLDGRQGQFAGKWKFVLLAIDIPKNNEQTPKAVESVFIALAGAQSNPNLIDQYWKGKIQESFSFELVSLGGYIQFLIRTPAHFRDLIEAAIYAQYPDAEITEVEDYAAPYKTMRFPNKEYDLWGAEMVLVKDYPYPIRTYPEFEHTLSGNFIDPMAGLLEILSRFGPDEQLWLQLVATPLKPPGWGETAKKIIKELKGEKYEAPKSFSDKAIGSVEKVVGGGANLMAEAFGFGGGEKKAEAAADQWRMFRLTPGERLVFERIANKLSKIAFRVKFRLVYFAKKESFAKGRGVGAVIGAIQQFNTADANGFKPGPRTKTAVDHFFIENRLAERKNRILGQYIKRTNYYGEPISNMMMSSEELASIWHFPVMTVKAPAMDKIPSRRVVPPSRLPYEGTMAIKTNAAEKVRQAEAETKDSFAKPAEETDTDQESAPPANLPTI